MDYIVSQIKIETLYYFYSAVFQGFAAMFALIMMSAIYYFQRNDTRRIYIEQRLENMAHYLTGYRNNSNENYEVNKIGIINYIDELFIKNPTFKESEMYRLRKYSDNLNKDEKFVKKILGIMLALSFLILMSSVFILHSCNIIFENKILLVLSSVLTLGSIIIYFSFSAILMYKIIGYKFLRKPIKWFLNH